MLKIEPLGLRHDREGFDCGNVELNDYLKKTARQHIEKGLSKTFVLVDDGSPERILVAYSQSLDAFWHEFMREWVGQGTG